MTDRTPPTAEHARLLEAREQGVPWRAWGPYLSERQWGTVREDYSADGDAWGYFTHEQSRSRAYRWGEDGIAGISDDGQRLCFALALWNGTDPILKERQFGLTNREGNHGEDVKEYYFYLDATPTHSYMRQLYKYPHAAYPYDDLVRTNAARSRADLEYELIDTGVFAEDRYFDVVVEYAKHAPDDLLVRITAINRGPDPAPLQLLPTLWFRNTWSWGAATGAPEAARPWLRAADDDGAAPGSRIDAWHPELGHWTLLCEAGGELLFTENETNTARLWGTPNATPYVKDAFHEYVVRGDRDAINPAATGTKAAVRYTLSVPPGAERTIRLRLRASGIVAGSAGRTLGLDAPAFDAVVDARCSEADHFYETLTPPSLSPDAAAVMRQALAGMLWGKQFYRYDVERWLAERGAAPFQPAAGPPPRNAHWHHMDNADIISMPDKWEYPWYAAWDLAFHAIALSLVDEDFSKAQLDLMLSAPYLHPNGQLPAYEWNFGDVNPPVHAWSTIYTHRLSVARGTGDLDWLERSFQKLLLNFTWWVNRKDRTGNNLFEGGFLGLDNIGLFDRSSPLPNGGHLEQADGTAWMALFSQNMLEIAIELAGTRPVYAELVEKFVEHFLWIATAMLRGGGGTGMWDDEDGFFYDVLQAPDGSATRLKVRSMVGLLPLCAVTVFSGQFTAAFPRVAARMQRFLEGRPELREFIHDPLALGEHGRRMASILDESRLRRVLARMLDESEFLGPHGIRSLSRAYLDHPYALNVGGQEYRIGYVPAESDSGMFGGNSNWRGPVWMPVNVLIIRALLQYHAYYGDAFTIECPTGSGHQMTLFEVAAEIARRLGAIFLRGEDGRRPVYGGTPVFQEDPHWRDLILFYEYFHGDNGAGLGASHQTGWTGVIAAVMHLFATTTAADVVDSGSVAVFRSRATVGAADQPRGAGADADALATAGA